MKIKKQKLKKKIKGIIILFFFVIMFFILGNASINVWRFFIRNDMNNTLIYKYNAFRNLDYQVFIVENEFINKPYIEMNRHYITELVDYINLNIGYEFSGVGDINLIYHYKVKGSLIGNLSGLSSSNYHDIWKIDVELIAEKNNDLYGSRFSINENIKIDLRDYNEMVNRFRQTLGIPIDAFLKINMIVNIEGIVNDEYFKETDNVIINIPLGVKTFHINKMVEENQLKEITKEETKEKEVGYFFLIYNLLLVLGAIFIIFIYLKRKWVEESYSVYQSKIKRIKKDYDFRIVNILNFIDLPEFKFIEVSAFDELLDFADEASGPILCYENNVNNDLQTWFFIIKGKIIYRYIIYENKIK